MHEFVSIQRLVVVTGTAMAAGTERRMVATPTEYPRAPHDLHHQLPLDFVRPEMEQM